MDSSPTWTADICQVLTPTAQKTQRQWEGYAQGTPQASRMAGGRVGEAGLVSEQRAGPQAEEASREGTEDRDREIETRLPGRESQCVRLWGFLLPQSILCGCWREACPNSSSTELRLMRVQRRFGMRVPETQGHRDMRSPRHRITETRDHRGTGAPRHGGTEARGHRDTRSPRHRVTEAQGHQGMGSLRSGRHAHTQTTDAHA